MSDHYFEELLCKVEELDYKQLQNVTKPIDELIEEFSVFSKEVEYALKPLLELANKVEQILSKNSTIDKLRQTMADASGRMFQSSKYSHDEIVASLVMHDRIKKTLKDKLLQDQNKSLREEILTLFRVLFLEEEEEQQQEKNSRSIPRRKIYKFTDTNAKNNDVAKNNAIMVSAGPSVKDRTQDNQVMKLLVQNASISSGPLSIELRDKGKGKVMAVINNETKGIKMEIQINGVNNKIQEKQLKELIKTNNKDALAKLILGVLELEHMSKQEEEDDNENKAKKSVCEVVADSIESKARGINSSKVLYECAMYTTFVCSILICGYMMHQNIKLRDTTTDLVVSSQKTMENLVDKFRGNLDKELDSLLAGDLMEDQVSSRTINIINVVKTTQEKLGLMDSDASITEVAEFIRSTNVKTRFAKEIQDIVRETLGNTGENNFVTGVLVGSSPMVGNNKIVQIINFSNLVWKSYQASSILGAISFLPVTLNVVGGIFTRLVDKMLPLLDSFTTLIESKIETIQYEVFESVEKPQFSSSLKIKILQKSLTLIHLLHCMLRGMAAVSRLISTLAKVSIWITQSYTLLPLFLALFSIVSNLVSLCSLML